MIGKIGIGLLIDDQKTFNNIRWLQLRLADSVGNWAGTNQPPHVTVKRPFDVADIDMLTQIENNFDGFFGGVKAFPLSYTGTANFGRQVLFLKVKPSSEVGRMHHNLVDGLEVLIPGSKQTAEDSDEMVFHTTLALSLVEDEFVHTEELANKLDQGQFVEPFMIKKAGLFFSSEGKHWIVIRQKELEP